MPEFQGEGKTLFMNKNIKYQSPIRPIFEKFGKQKDVELIYGEPIEYKNKFILPVAKTCYFVGGGSGGGTNLENGEPASGQGYGEGGGGHITVKPLGVYEITEDYTKFRPAVDMKFFTIAAAVLTLGLTFLLKNKDK